MIPEVDRGCEPKTPARRHRFAVDLSRWITHSLTTRRAPHGTMAAKLEGRLKTAGSGMWRRMQKRPVASSLVVGAGAIAASASVGLGELTLAVAITYAAYQVLREGVSPKQAAERVLGQAEHAR